MQSLAIDDGLNSCWKFSFMYTNRVFPSTNFYENFKSLHVFGTLSSLSEVTDQTESDWN